MKVVHPTTHQCLFYSCNEVAHSVAMRGELIVYRCSNNHEFSVRAHEAVGTVSKEDRSELEYMQRRRMANMEGWCMRREVGDLCDCALCKQLH